MPDRMRTLIDVRAPNGLHLTWVRVEHRHHWDYKPLHWLTFGIWAALAYVLFPPFRRRWKSGVHHAAWDGKTKDGAAIVVYSSPGSPPNGQVLMHEAWHGWQMMRDGVLKHSWRLLTSTRWRIFLEAEAYAYSDVPLHRAVASLMAGAYFVFWPRPHVFGLATVAYAGLRKLENQ